jgi:hypothetical protein
MITPPLLCETNTGMSIPSFWFVATESHNGIEMITSTHMPGQCGMTAAEVSKL